MTPVRTIVPLGAPRENVMDRVRSSVERMEKQNGSVTLHVHEGKVVRIETRVLESTATMQLSAVTP